MKRWALRLCVLLLLGAIINVAVAWGIAGFVSVPIRKGFFRELPLEDARAYWLSHAPQAWHGSEIIEGNAVESWAFGRADLLVTTMEDIGKQSVGITYDHTGWPLLSMQYTATIVVNGGVAHTECQWCWRLKSDWLKSKTLPLCPLWPGFAINTVFYAAIWWGVSLLFATPFALRKRWRIKRGLCLKCAYPIGTSERCTECGASRMVRLLDAA